MSSIPIATVRTREDAELVRGLLASEGIDSWVVADDAGPPIRASPPVFPAHTRAYAREREAAGAGGGGVTGALSRRGRLNARMRHRSSRARARVLARPRPGEEEEGAG